MTPTTHAVPPILTSVRDLELRYAASTDVVRVTPVFSVGSLSARCGGEISVKAENLQRTGSFKLRGTISKLQVVQVIAGHSAED